MNRSPAGFTLLEVIVTLAILGLVLVLLTQGVRAVDRASELYQRTVREQTDLIPVEQTLRRMIERMDPGQYPQPPVVRGSARALAFTTEMPDGMSVGDLSADVLLEVVNGTLELQWTPHARGVPFGPPPAPHRSVLLHHVARLEVSFSPKGSPGGWQAAWSMPALPGLVRLRLILSDNAHPWPTIIARPSREQAEE